MDPQLVPNLLAALVFAILGIVILVASFVVLDKISPYDLWREIVEKQNTALAVLAGFGRVNMTRALFISFARGRCTAVFPAHRPRSAQRGG